VAERAVLKGPFKRGRPTQRNCPDFGEKGKIAPLQKTQKVSWGKWRENSQQAVLFEKELFRAKRKPEEKICGPLI